MINDKTKLLVTSHIAGRTFADRYVWHNIVCLHWCRGFKTPCEVKVMLSFSCAPCLSMRKMPHWRLLIDTPTGRNLTSCQNTSVVTGHCWKFLEVWGHILQFFLKAINTFIESRNSDRSWGKSASHFPLSIIVTTLAIFFLLNLRNLLSVLLSVFRLYSYFLCTRCLLNHYLVKEQTMTVILLWSNTCVWALWLFLFCL